MSKTFVSTLRKLRLAETEPDHAGIHVGPIIPRQQTDAYHRERLAMASGIMTLHDRIDAPRHGRGGPFCEHSVRAPPVRN